MLSHVFLHPNIIVSLLFLLVALYAFFNEYLIKADLRQIPGPKTYAVTRYRLAWEAWRAHMVRSVNQLHLQYGNVVRIAPNEVSFNSLSALRTIYGAGSAFERTSFYHMFDAYGRPNLFSMGSGKVHRERKKLLSHIYSNQMILGSTFSDLVKRKVDTYLQMIQREPEQASETFASLHYFSFDTISEFVYGPDHGGTKAMSLSHPDRGLLSDILNPARRKLAWFAVHFPMYTKWITSRTGQMERIVNALGLVPMKKPFVYSGIRAHALRAFWNFKAASADTKTKLADTTVIGRLMRCQTEQGLSDMDIASECADHLLAGIDTTSDSSMFLIWALSLPQNRKFQEQLRAEVSQVLVDQRGISAPRDVSQLPYLNAVIRETLRLYAPLPTMEPRVSHADTVVDGYKIPAGTVVSMSPYCLHREPTIFADPLVFNPERWLVSTASVTETLSKQVATTRTGPSLSLIPESDPRNRYFWSFSSGARMCIGMHLANVEMVTLIAAVFRNYRTSVRANANAATTSPAITSRFEVFHDETMSNVIEHECWIDFEKL